jgi:NADPH:quinone reductase-like Zn-dependent oxidoreductase
VLASTRCRVLIVRANRADLDQLATWLAGGLRVPIHARFPIRDLARAFERHSQGDARGRIVIDVDGGWAPAS